MQRHLQLTADGSHTIAIDGMDITYHSKHGAIQESEHVFIKAGLHYCMEQQADNVRSLSILEMGFGTGLNALLTAIEAEKKDYRITYHSIEKFPLELAEAAALNHGKLAGNTLLFEQLHKAPWGSAQPINKHLTLIKHHTTLLEFKNDQLFHCIYFDAFAPNAQPELWTSEVFTTLYDRLYPNGILVTYCSKGYVRRNMEAAGFRVTKIPGPPGKREMVRAIRD